VHLIKTETPLTRVHGTEGSVRHFLTACGTFASNIVGRVQEHADARLADELTMIEQRRQMIERAEKTTAYERRQTDPSRGPLAG